MGVVQSKAFLNDKIYPDKTIVRRGDQFQEMLNFLGCSPVITFDHETTGLEWFRDSRSCGLALAGFDKSTSRVHSYYVPYRHQTGESMLDFSLIAPSLKYLLEDESRTKIAHNLKFDEHFSRREGWKVKGLRYDTMIAARLFDENKPLGLKFRAWNDLGRRDADEWETKVEVELTALAKLNGLGKSDYKSRYGYSQVAIPILGTYACFDAEFTLNLYTLYEKSKISEKYKRIWKTEMGLTEVLCDMETIGLPIDVNYLENLRDALRGIKAGLESEIFRMLGREIKLGSDAVIRKLLVDQFGIKLTKQTKKSTEDNVVWAVDSEVLKQHKNKHPVIGMIIDWRDVEKLLNTYTTSILKRLDKNNILHADFQQVGTDTGRLSCRQPNFQNMPSDSDSRAEKHSGKDLEHGGVDPWSIRRAFITRGGKWVRLFFDYSQIELRCIAYYSRDPVMVDNYLKNGDIHNRTSLEVFGSKEKKHRRISKVINFGISYGLSSGGLSRQAGISLEEADHFMNIFFKRYSGLSQFRDIFWHVVKSRKDCSFQNIFGRPRRVRHIANPNPKVRGRGERQAIATLIQGTAAELTKESLVRISNRFKELALPAYLVNTVHDEIQADCHTDVLEQTSRIMKEEMENFPDFDPIPIVVDGDYSIKSWADKQSLPI